MKQRLHLLAHAMRNHVVVLGVQDEERAGERLQAASVHRTISFWSSALDGRWNQNSLFIVGKFNLVLFQKVKEAVLQSWKERVDLRETERNRMDVGPSGTSAGSKEQK